ncbi:MAG: rod shape-determining protein MreD [Spirochaetaceae bacterium]
MNKRTLFYTISIGIVLLIIVVQSVVFPIIFKNDYMPDLSLIAIIYFSINFGRNIGQILGFSSGLVLDSLSGVPFGLNTMVKLIMGFLLGFFEGKIFLDKFILPCIIITLCTIAKFAMYSFVALIFPIDLNINFFSFRYLIELGLNIVLTPFIFMLFNLLAKKLYPVRERV